MMGGVAALRQVRAAGIDMPIIALTACVKPALDDCGFIDVTAKPLARTQCRNILAQHGRV